MSILSNTNKKINDTTRKHLNCFFMISFYFNLALHILHKANLPPVQKNI